LDGIPAQVVHRPADQVLIRVLRVIAGQAVHANVLPHQVPHRGNGSPRAVIIRAGNASLRVDTGNRPSGRVVHSLAGQVLVRVR
jgi:hypothetical protein